MAINDSGSQPQGDAETHSSFLGTGFQHEIVAEQEPAPTAEEQADDAIAQVTEGTEEQEQQQVEEPEQPTLPEWLQDFPQDVLDKFAKRYPSAWRRLNDPNTSADDQFLIRDKINDYLEIQGLRSQREEPTLEEEEEAVVAPVQQQPVVATPEQKQQYRQAIENLVKQTVDPGSLEQLGKDLLSGFGVDLNIKPDNEEYENVQSLVRNAPKVGATLANGAVDLLATVLPHILGPMLPQLVEQSFPDFGAMHDTAMYARQWDAVRNAVDKSGTPLYSDELPAYGTKEFGKALRQAAQSFPGFDQMKFTDRNGRELPKAQQAKMKYEMLARHLSGQKVQPAEVKAAVETGKQIAKRTEQSRAAGKALGAGQSKPTSAPTGNDVNKDIIAAYNARNGNIWK